MISGSPFDSLSQEPFQPQPWLRNAHIQSILASSRIRSAGPNPMADASREMILDAGSGVRLKGFYSPRPNADARGLVTLLHGWEGSSDSAYILSTGRYLFRKGFSIFRLNYRDHGDTHHLNEGLFHGALLDETFRAVQLSAALDGNRPFFIMGFSLGANFGLRIALRHAANTIPNLKHVLAVSPSLDPYKTTLAVDQGPAFYRMYFLRKWKRSLRKKEALFPHRYHFGRLLKKKSILELTDALRDYYPDFPTYMDYFHRYTLVGDALAGLTVPVTLIASKDDPIVPADDLLHLTDGPFLHRVLLSHGGHCGFIERFPGVCWYEREAERIFS